MTERINSAWSPSSREVERGIARRRISRKQALIAAISTTLVLGTLAAITEKWLATDAGAPVLKP